MSKSRTSKHNRAITSAIGVILIVAITVILASVIGVVALGITDDLGEKPAFAALDLSFEEEQTDSDNYDEFRWQIELTNIAGDTAQPDEIVVYLDHGNQRVTGTLNRSLRAGETVELTVVHNNQNGNTIPDDTECTDINVACRLAGDDGNYPKEDYIQLQMIHKPSGSILYQEQTSISGKYGIYNENSDPKISNETLIFA
ncbi:type IV pilin [Halorubrum sp. BOL3-1]|uniref:type IV pilin n=1 Tax=Halorubrum sp. BOL3-1 TaxID=2497325 RepID=UPI001005005B|nr:type IV pilin N-terminal domain-containing protein [Halorubrum sp. BOL3-1]QAU14183.1 type IV pilin [Halorubrum sp. BOL3-1]